VPARHRGFTLIEVLVVIVIIAIMVSFAVISVHVTGKDRELDEESQRIEGLYGLLKERAALEGRDFGMRLTPTMYEFLQYDTRREYWRKLDQETEFRRRPLPKGALFKLRLESRTVVLDERQKPPPRRDEVAIEAAPQIVIAASGEATPFELELDREGSDARARLTADDLGKIKRLSPDQADPRP
jgi:general secretion pathway protein H